MTGLLLIEPQGLRKFVPDFSTKAKVSPVLLYILERKEEKDVLKRAKECQKIPM